jgi:hypothetical protein
MIPVQMRQKNHVYVAEIETGLPPGREYTCAEIDDQRATATVQTEAGMRPRAGVEGITRSDEGHAHR